MFIHKMSYRNIKARWENNLEVFSYSTTSTIYIRLEGKHFNNCNDKNIVTRLNNNKVCSYINFLTEILKKDVEKFLKPLIYLNIFHSLLSIGEESLIKGIDSHLC